jgi:hypothetical protein
MKPVFAWTFPGGKPKDNYSTATATVGNAHVNKDITVPSGKRWLLWFGRMGHDDSVAHVMNIEVYNSDNKLLCKLISADAGGAGNGMVHFPTNIVLTSTEAAIDSGAFPIPLKAGDYIRYEAATVMTDASVEWEYVAVVTEIDEP